MTPNGAKPLVMIAHWVQCTCHGKGHANEAESRRRPLLGAGASLRPLGFTFWCSLKRSVRQLRGTQIQLSAQDAQLSHNLIPTVRDLAGGGSLQVSVCNFQHPTFLTQGFHVASFFAILVWIRGLWGVGAQHGLKMASNTEREIEMESFPVLGPVVYGTPGEVKWLCNECRRNEPVRGPHLLPGADQ